MIDSGDSKCIMTVADLNPKKLGSLEMFTISLSQSLNKKRVKSVIVFNNEIPDHLKILYEGIIVETVSINNGLWAFYSDMYELVKKYKPNIVHFHFYSFFAVSTIPIFLFGIKNIIFTDHSSVGTKEKFGLNKFFVGIKNKVMSQYIKNIICVSNYIKKRDMNIPGMDISKLICIYNGVFLERFKPTTDRLAYRKELGIDDNIFVAVTAVSLIKAKGVNYLLHATKKLTDKYNDILFLIAGDGPERKELEALSEELNVGRNVRFLGMRNNVEQILATSDVYVYPSIWQEACALGLIEAMACGLPIVATSVGGTPEIVVDGVTGIIIKPQDSQSISDALEVLYNDRQKCELMGQKSFERSQEMFDLDRQIKETINVYKEYLR